MWQDIETAPQDGTIVLIGWSGDFMPEIAHYHAELGWLDECHDGFAEHPTHWMPLPEPPPA